MGDNHERANILTKCPWSSFEVRRIVAGKKAKRREEFAGDLDVEKRFP